MWGLVSGGDPRPTEDDKKTLSWNTKDAKIKTWILDSVEPQYILNLKPYKTSKEMWEYLKQVYHQGHSARQYQLELEIARYSQGTSSIQDYYTGFLNLWAEYDDIKYLNVSEASEIQKLGDQFLMKLRSEYEIIRSNLMSSVPSPSLDECLNELLCEEQSQLTQHVLKQQSSGTSPDVAYAASANYTPGVSHVPRGIVHHNTSAAKGQRPAWDLSKIQCFGCKSYSHYAS